MSRVIPLIHEERSEARNRAALATSSGVPVVELTDAGEEAFLRLRTAAVAFDRRLRAGITGEEVAALEDVLDRLVRNVSADDEPRPWAGLLEANP